MSTELLSLVSPVFDHSNDSFVDIVMPKGLEYREPFVPSKKKLLENFATCGRNFTEMTRDLNAQLKFSQGVDFVPPTLGVLGAEAAAMSYEELLAEVRKRVTEASERLESVLLASGVGILQWYAPDAAKFGYLVNSKSETALETRLTRTRHIHELVAARSISLDTATRTLEIPKDVEALISRLSPPVKRCCRIVTGHLIVEATDTPQVTIVPKPVKRAIDVVATTTKEAASDIARDIRQAAVSSVSATSRSTASWFERGWQWLKNQVSKFDPALVFANEIVLAGWVEDRRES